MGSSPSRETHRSRLERKTRLVRVTVLTQYYPPEVGAPQARLSELVRHLRRHGHEVTVLTAMPNYPTGKVFSGYGGVFRREDVDGTKILRAWIWPTQRATRFARIASYLSFVVSSFGVGAVALPKSDILVCESPPLFLGMTGYALARVKAARWVMNVSDLWPDSAIELGVIGPGLAARLAYSLERFCYRKAALVTGQSPGIVASIRSRHPSVNALLFSNGVDTHLFRPENRDPAVREELAAGAPVIVLYAGLHGLAQGLDTVLDAAAHLDAGAARFVLIGDGPEKAQLVERAADRNLSNVEFRPPEPRERMPTIVASADIAVVTLRTNLTGAVPSKLYEAMASGVPIVLAAEGESADVVRAARCGVVVTPGDPVALADAIRTLAADAEARAAMGTAGRVAAVDTFDREELCDRLISELTALSA